MKESSFEKFGESVLVPMDRMKELLEVYETRENMTYRVNIKHVNQWFAIFGKEEIVTDETFELHDMNLVNMLDTYFEQMQLKLKTLSDLNGDVNRLTQEKYSYKDDLKEMKIARNMWIWATCFLVIMLIISICKI